MQARLYVLGHALRSVLTEEDVERSKAGVDLFKLSIEELETLVRDAQTEIAERKEAERERVLQQVRELAGSVGMSVEELLELEKAATRRTGEAKYRHPEKAELTWSGRGKRPQWVTDALVLGELGRPAIQLRRRNPVAA